MTLRKNTAAAIGAVLIGVAGLSGCATQVTSPLSPAPAAAAEDIAENPRVVSDFTIERATDIVHVSVFQELTGIASDAELLVGPGSEGHRFVRDLNRADLVGFDVVSDGAVLSGQMQIDQVTGSATVWTVWDLHAERVLIYTPTTGPAQNFTIGWAGENREPLNTSGVVTTDRSAKNRAEDASVAGSGIYRVTAPIEVGERPAFGRIALTPQDVDGNRLGGPLYLEARAQAGE